MKEVTAQLLTEGVDIFARSFEELLSVIAQKREQLAKV